MLLLQFKLFYAKLQKSLEHATVEIHKFHEDKLDRNKSSFLELMLSPKKNQKSDYTFSEWEDIHTNLKSSLIFMEQIMVDIKGYDFELFELLFNVNVFNLLEDEYHISVNVN